MTHSLKQVAKWSTHTHTHIHTPSSSSRNLWTSQVFRVCGLLTHLSEFKWLKGCLEFWLCVRASAQILLVLLAPLADFSIYSHNHNRHSKGGGSRTHPSPPLPLHTPHCRTWNALSAFGFTLTLFGRKAKHDDGRQHLKSLQIDVFPLHSSKSQLWRKILEIVHILCGKISDKCMEWLSINAKII